ncbi:MAG: hypothetical protein MHM6MM_002093 [Cercozoa sp. M6MM]
MSELTPEERFFLARVQQLRRQHKQKTEERRKQARRETRNAAARDRSDAPTISHSLAAEIFRSTLSETQKSEETLPKRRKITKNQTSAEAQPAERKLKRPGSQTKRPLPSMPPPEPVEDEVRIEEHAKGKMEDSDVEEIGRSEDTTTQQIETTENATEYVESVQPKPRPRPSASLKPKLEPPTEEQLAQRAANLAEYNRQLVENAAKQVEDSKSAEFNHFLAMEKSDNPLQQLMPTVQLSYLVQVHDRDLSVRPQQAQLLSVDPDAFAVARRTIMVGNIPAHWQRHDVRDFFSGFGGIVSVRVAKTSHTAFVTFRRRGDATEAIEKANGEEVQGSELHCDWSRMRILRT